MKLRHLVACVLLASVAVQTSASAQTARIAAETNESIQKHEAEMNALCGKIKKKMRPNEWAEFEKAQKAWVAFRTLQVGFYENNQMRFEGSQNLPLFVKDELTEARVKQLKELLESWSE